jgi:hypothetical protein
MNLERRLPNIGVPFETESSTSARNKGNPTRRLAVEPSLLITT